MVRKDSAAPERAHQRFAKTPLVGAFQVAIRRNQRAQILTELHVSRRAVVDGADANREELAGHVTRFAGERFHQRLAERRRSERLRLDTRDAKVPVGLSAHDRHERFEDGRDEHRPQQVRIELGVVAGRAALCPRQNVRIEGGKAVDVDARPQRGFLSRRAPGIAELAREVREQRKPARIHVRLANRPFHHVGVREVKEQRHEVGESFVEGGHVHVRRHEKRLTQPVEERVRRFVRDDVVAERRADQPLLHGEARGIRAGVEVAEREVAALAAVARVSATKAEWPHDQPMRPAPGRGRRPADVAAERSLERRIGQAADGVHHLQMNLTVRWRRCEAAREQQQRVVEVERSARERRRDAVAPDIEERADRPFRELLVRHVHRREAAKAIGDRRVQREYPQRPDEWLARIAPVRPHGCLPGHAVADFERA